MVWSPSPPGNHRLDGTNGRSGIDEEKTAKVWVSALNRTPVIQPMMGRRSAELTRPPFCMNSYGAAAVSTHAHSLVQFFGMYMTPVTNLLQRVYGDSKTS
jgi:hypothetical protein